jgi:hypothetical protein
MMFLFVFGAVLMVWYVLFLELFSWYGMLYCWSCSHGMVCFIFGAVQIQKENIPYHENSSKNKTYQTMRTAPKAKHTIPREQLQKQNIPYNENSSKNKKYTKT